MIMIEVYSSSSIWAFISMCAHHDSSPIPHCSLAFHSIFEKYVGRIACRSTSAAVEKPYHPLASQAFRILQPARFRLCCGSVSFRVGAGARYGRVQERAVDAPILPINADIGLALAINRPSNHANWSVFGDPSMPFLHGPVRHLDSTSGTKLASIFRQYEVTHLTKPDC